MRVSSVFLPIALCAVSSVLALPIWGEGEGRLVARIGPNTGFDPVGSIRCFVEVMAKGKAKSTFCKNHNPRELQESSLELEARDVDENVLLSRDNEVDFEARELEDEALEARDVFHPQMEERDVEAVAEGLLRRIAPNYMDPFGAIRCFGEVMAKGKAKSSYCKNRKG